MVPESLFAVAPTVRWFRDHDRAQRRVEAYTSCDYAKSAVTRGPLRVNVTPDTTGHLYGGTHGTVHGRYLDLVTRRSLTRLRAAFWGSTRRRLRGASKPGIRQRSVLRRSGIELYAINAEPDPPEPDDAEDSEEATEEDLDDDLSGSSELPERSLDAPAEPENGGGASLEPNGGGASLEPTRAIRWNPLEMSHWIKTPATPLTSPTTRLVPGTSRRSTSTRTARWPTTT